MPQEIKEKYENWNEEDEALYEKAKELIIKLQRVSPSLLQRYFKIGYACSARLLDVLEERRIIGAVNYPYPRKVLIPPKN